MCQDLEQVKFDGERQKLQLIRKGKLEAGVEHPLGLHSGSRSDDFGDFWLIPQF